MEAHGNSIQGGENRSTDEGRPRCPSHRIKAVSSLPCLVRCSLPSADVLTRVLAGSGRLVIYDISYPVRRLGITKRAVGFCLGLHSARAHTMPGRSPGKATAPTARQNGEAYDIAVAFSAIRPSLMQMHGRAAGVSSRGKARVQCVGRFMAGPALCGGQG